MNPAHADVKAQRRGVRPRRPRGRREGVVRGASGGVRRVHGRSPESGSDDQCARLRCAAAHAASRAPRARALVICSRSRQATAVRPQPSSRRPARSMAWMPLAASLILVAAVGAYAVRLQLRVGELQSSMAVLVGAGSGADRSRRTTDRAAVDRPRALEPRSRDGVCDRQPPGAAAGQGVSGVGRHRAGAGQRRSRRAR